MTSRARVLIVAEGSSEIGDLDRFAPTRRGAKKVTEGYIPPMLRKLLGVKRGDIEITAQKVTNIGRHETKARLKGDGDRAAKALTLALVDGCALLVFVKDVDREPGKKRSAGERKKRVQNKHEEIEAGFAAVTGADNVLRIKATPCRMLEAWALGDVKAIKAVGGKRTRVSEVPAYPEDTWGDEADAGSGHPKCVLRRVLAGKVNASVFEDLANEARPDALRKTCPESFAPFADEAVAAARELRKR